PVYRCPGPHVMPKTTATRLGKFVRKKAAGSSGAGSGLKYRQVYDQLKSAIESGELSPGQKLPTDEALVNQFNVSRNTIIRAVWTLRDEGLVGRVQGSGTFVSGKSSEVSQRIAFIANGEFDFETKSTVFGRVEQEIERLLLYEHQIELVVQPYGGGRSNAAFRRKSVRDALDSGITAAFYLPGAFVDDRSGLHDEVLGEFAASRVPVVLLDCDTARAESPRAQYDLVGLNNHLAGVEIGRRLLEKPTRKVLFLSYAGAPISVQERYAGLRSVVESDGRAELILAEPATIDVDSIAAAMRRYTPDAVVTKDDSVAAAVMRHLYLEKIQVPHEVRVAGFDDSPIASELIVPLTTYGQPTKYLARAAVDMVVSRIQEPDQPARQMAIAGQLIVRESA
ncbi:MAG: GntR family transcriptional regulator, partial [Planctomycetota bacterium]